MRSEREQPVAFVTGAGTRLGHAIAEMLAARGYRMILHANRSLKEAHSLAVSIHKAGGDAQVLKADLANVKQTERLARQAWSAYGRIDVLVNNAAVFWPTPLEKLNVREFEAFIGPNLRAPYLLAAKIGRKMKRRGSGVVVNLACVSALRAWKEYLPYSISKAGVVSLTVGLAKLLAPEVRVNAIAPGPVLPPEKLSTSARAALIKRVPLKRLGQAQDIVRAVGYLLDADYTTGQVLCVDGGRSIV